MNNLDVKIVCEHDRYMPTYANDTDACMDMKVKITDLIRVAPEKYEKNKSWLLPGDTKVFGTGIKVAIPEGYVMLVFPRSSTGIKLRCMLTNTTGVIDAGYRDEIKLALTNFGDNDVLLEDGQRVAQFMIIPRPQVRLTLCNDDDKFRNGDRGGGIGSTGI